jgi:hypothetical protein
MGCSRTLESELRRPAIGPEKILKFLGDLPILERIRSRLDEIEEELKTLDRVILIASVAEAAACLRKMNDLRKEQQLLKG